MIVRSVLGGAVLAASLTSCAGTVAPALVRVERPQDIPGLVAWVQEAFHRNFVLDRLPEGKESLEAGFLYLVTESEVDLVRDPLAKAGTVYAAEFEVERRDTPSKKMRVVLYSPTADFSGEVVHGYFGAGGHHGGIFLGFRKTGARELPPFKVARSPKDVPGLIDRVKGNAENDFVLDHFPEGTRTLEEGFKYLAGESSRDLIRKALGQGNPVHGAEFTIEKGGETFKVFAYSPMPDFSSKLVYALFGANGHPHGVYRARD